MPKMPSATVATRDGTRAQSQLVGPGEEFVRQASILFAKDSAHVGGELLGISIGTNHDG